MASVIFFRAVNVGAHQRFLPAQLAKELAAFDVMNIGAAGTFIVRANVSGTKLREEIHQRLQFKPELMICPAREVLELTGSDPFQDAPAGKDIGRFVSIVPKALGNAPSLPLEVPNATEWEVRIHRISGQFIFCVRRPGKKDLYPNAVVEKQLGVSATTRNWNTFVKIGELLKA